MHKLALTMVYILKLEQ